MSKSALGRGLSALLGGKPPGGAPAGVPAKPVSPPVTAPAAGPDSTSAAPAAPPVPGGESEPRPPVGVRRVPVQRVVPSSLQPRRDFPPESLRELADSVREQGILQPLIVRARGETYELIAGERRWRAAQLVGLTEVPIVEREADDATALELMLVENLQREDLNPMDEAQGYAELGERFQLTQEAIATKVGRSRAAVANALRLLKLPTEVQGLLKDRRLSTGHAKVLLGLASAEQQSLAANRVTHEGLSVRQTEELVSQWSAAPAPKTAPGKERSQPAVALRDPHVVAVEDRLRQRLGTKVSVRYREGRGQIDIRFFSDDELERVLDIVGVRID